MTQSKQLSTTAKTTIQTGSNRVFGIVFATIFAVIGLWPLLKMNLEDIRYWALGISGLFLLAALVFPPVLAPLNRLWMWFGLLLHNIVSPLVMGMLFFIVVTPMGLLMRLFGVDPMKRDYDGSVDSYWVSRGTGEPTPETMRNQF